MNRNLLFRKEKGLGLKLLVSAERVVGEGRVFLSERLMVTRVSFRVVLEVLDLCIPIGLCVKSCKVTIKMVARDHHGQLESLLPM